MSVTRFHTAIWKQDFKILGAALSRYIRSKFSRLISKIHNIENPFPLHRNAPKRPSTTISSPSKNVYYGEGAHDNNVVLLRYIKLSTD
ncbi:hypothetical protein AB6F64_08490 [Providencia hangzhouensis]|uniref:Uncharacterized protein n=1 Tax=Providencia rettgeri TaxID=587 RepID=A0AAJ4TJI6_PRORE|nr:MULTISPECIES: hypothetical protein [Providencia]MBJ9971441.1 hypothetical protein [Providencia rettgeri]MCB6144225.1 hypothetical protein [Providencia rettgeri]MCF8964525.1 hypothetical protein [Providencia rettgeri]MDB9566699.1 hypothetical protein [Providencia rettgeri]QWQ18345.1 hypothetical protein KOL65_07655 [Providencia rettgeri]